MILKLFTDEATPIRRSIILLLTVGFFTFLYLFNKGEKIQLSNQSGTSFEKAVVQNVVTDNLQQDGSRVGNQQIMVKILTGNLKGQILQAVSASGYLYGATCKAGMKVIVSISTSGNTTLVTVSSFYREPIIFGFIAIFLMLLWAIGGKRGFKSAIGLIFTFICIIFLFIPMLYKGYSPFLAAVIVVILVTIVSFYLIGGISIKTLSSILSTIIGVIIAGSAAAAFGYFANISGFNVSDVEELIFIANNTNLKVAGILFAGILIASLGAVMDVSISIASSINELYSSNPKLTRKELFYSGVNVGRDIMGAMSNTLILAFTGGAINTLIFIYAYNMRYNQVINMYSVGIEVMQAISGSLAIILTVPLVSFITSGLLIYKPYSKNNNSTL